MFNVDFSFIILLMKICFVDKKLIITVKKKPNKYFKHKYIEKKINYYKLFIYITNNNNNYTVTLLIQ